MKKTILLLFLAAFSNSVLFSQVTLTYNTSPASSAVGSTIFADVTVNDWNNVLSAQFSMNFDETILEFQTFSMLNLQDLSQGNFSSTGKATGDLSVSWFDNTNVSGVTVPNGTKIFRIEFKVLAAGSTSLEFSGIPSPIEFTDGTGIISTNLQNSPTFSVGTAATIPTMGEWGLIILGLLVLTFGTVAMRRRQLAFAGGSNEGFTFRNAHFNKKSFTKMLLLVGVGLVATFAIAITFFGYEMTNADVPGSLLALPLAAYLLHLLGSNE